MEQLRLNFPATLAICISDNIAILSSCLARDKYISHSTAAPHTKLFAYSISNNHNSTRLVPRFPMAADAAQAKKITLREFKSEEFRVWEVTTKATLKLHKLLGIVDGTDPNPTPRNPDGTIRAISAALRTQINKWENDHERAREAIIRCLPNAELLKLVDVQDDASAIWRRLHDEYGRSSNLEYVRASNDLALLKKDD
jgi:hypothetical protein